MFNLSRPGSIIPPLAGLIVLTCSCASEPFVGQLRTSCLGSLLLSAFDPKCQNTAGGGRVSGKLFGERKKKVGMGGGAKVFFYATHISNISYINFGQKCVKSTA